jgi:ADP-ribose diphosphatase
MPSVTRPRRLRHRTIYKGRIFRVDRDLVRLTNGRRVDLEVVRHRGSVVLLPQPTPRHVVLIRQFRYAINRWLWELPAGSLEPGESPAACARRECEEEIGLTPGRVVRLGAWYPTPGFCDEVMVFFLCRQLRPPAREVARDLDEQIEPRVFTLAEAARLVDRGRIVDMKTVLGLRLVRTRRP